MLLATILIFDVILDLDRHLADQLFAWQGGTWTLQHHWLTETVIHTDGRRLVAIMLIGLLSALVISHLRSRWHPYRRGLIYLFTTILVSFALVNGIKAVSGIPCPWDITRYGGHVPFRDWLTGFSGSPGCFPAGHASGGYVWVALYFFALVHCFKYRYQTLTLTMLMGLVFGIAQQLRGAHFLSHDLVTLGICWFTSLFIFMLWFRKDLPALTTVPARKED